MNIVHECIAVLDLKGLPDPHADHSRRIDASVLIDHDGLRRSRSLRKIPLQPDEDISKAAVNCGCDILLNDTLARIHLSTHWIHAHSDDRIAGQLSGQMDVSFDRAGIALSPAVNCEKNGKS